jgi:inward rectifier potassium channel
MLSQLKRFFLNQGSDQSTVSFGRSEQEFTLIRLGLPTQHWQDLYHLLLTIPWPGFLTLIGLLYVATNIVFALAYLIGGPHISNAEPGSFWDAFSFSVQTMATIGYGSMYPATPYADFLVAVEALVGLLGVSMVAGLMFARVSRPTARVMFSRVAVVTQHNGQLTLMFRTANRRRNQIVEAQIRVTLLRNEITQEGEYMRRLHDLQLVRRTTPLFIATWTVMHPITPDSPLYGESEDSLAQSEAFLIVTLTGIDESYSQTVHARHIFPHSEILWHHQFVDLFRRAPDGRRSIDYTSFHDVIPASPRQPKQGSRPEPEPCQSAQP